MSSNGALNFLDWLTSCRNQFLYLSIALSAPSILLYIAQIFIILRFPEFHNSFFVLFVCRSIPNLLFTLNSFYSWRLPILFGQFFYSFYSQFPQWLLLIAPFLTTLCFQAENFASVFLLINRLSAILFPLSHKKFWRIFLPIVLLFIYLYPAYNALDNFKLDAVVQLETPNSTSLNFFIHVGLNPGDLGRMYFSQAIFAVIFLAICSLVNIATFIAYRRHKMRMNIGNNENDVLRNKIERNLLVYAIATFAGQILITAIQISIYAFYLSGNSSIYMVVLSQLPWIMDATTLALPSWLLLWASENVRTKLAKTFLPNKIGQFRNGQTNSQTKLFTKVQSAPQIN